MPGQPAGWRTPFLRGFTVSLEGVTRAPWGTEDSELAGCRIKLSEIKVGRSRSAWSPCIPAGRGKQVCDPVKVSDISRALFLHLGVKPKAFAVLWWALGEAESPVTASPAGCPVREGGRALLRAGSEPKRQQGDVLLHGFIQKRRAAQTHDGSAAAVWLCRTLI